MDFVIKDDTDNSVHRCTMDILCNTELQNVKQKVCIEPPKRTADQPMAQ